MPLTHPNHPFPRQKKPPQHLAFIASIDRRIQSARAQLTTHLAAALAAALAQRQWQAAAHCLHAYVELGEVPAGEATLRGALAAPLAAEAVAEAKKRVAADPGAWGLGGVSS